MHTILVGCLNQYTMYLTAVATISYLPEALMNL